ncbi:MAG TPA: cyclic nucleotide-gated ion channel [Xanthobacteraceae bacterium]|jgi:voltage-gated potassium channel|nr:cyclic nucleotide-gated ion channel [Xanthobacteraceae bacterium]
MSGAVSAFSRYTASIRRFVVSAMTRYVALGAGLLGMTMLTVPDLRGSFGLWLNIGLWLCLGYFVFDGIVRISAARRAGRARSYLGTPAGVIDVLSIVPVPLALVCGITPETAWLLAALWVLKLTQDSPGFAQLGRVFVVEANALASVLVLFLIALFLASAAMYALERQNQPQVFGTLPAALWWAVETLTTTGYGDEVPLTALGRLLGAMVMICGIATFGLWTGILATGFAAENRRRNFIQTWDLVSKVPFLQTLDPSAITEITHMMRRVEVPARTAVIRRGKVGDCMYFIAEGEVEVDVEPAPIRLGAGAFFGELALLGDLTRTANVSTTNSSTLLVLDLADFRTVMAHHSELARAIDAEAKRRQGDNQRRRELHAHEVSS